MFPQKIMTMFSYVVTMVVFVFAVYTIFGGYAFSDMKDKILDIVDSDVANKKMAGIITTELNAAHKSFNVMITILQILLLAYIVAGLLNFFSVVIDVIILCTVAYGIGYITYNLFMLRKFRMDLVNQINEERA